MAVFQHITQAKRIIKQRLLDELPSWITQATNAIGDDVPLPTPIVFEVWLTDKADIGGPPSIEIIVTDSVATSDSYAQVYRHRLVIGITIGGDNEEYITTLLERYLWAVRQTLRDAILFPPEHPQTAPVELGGEQYSPLVERPGTVESPFVKGAFIEVFVTTVEDQTV